LNGDDAGICRFGAGRLARLHRAFVSEIAGVRKGSDPECIHRMRVASRRLRIALPLFKACFPKVKYRQWVKEFAAVSRALGNARDADVQILFLDRFLSDNPRNHQEEEGIQKIRDFLEDRRRKEQERVLFRLDILTEKGILQEISIALKDAGGQTAGTGQRRSEGALAALAGVSIGSAWDRFLLHGCSVRDPYDTAGHHALRIAAKKLRYTIEVFGPLFPDKLKPAVRGLKTLQELLGEIHDCDVWLQLLSTQDADDPGVLSLFISGKTTRQERHRRLVAEWEETIEGPFREYMSSVPGVVPERKGSGPRVQEKTGSEEQVPGIYYGGDGHARRVTELALQLFDDLAPLHGYGVMERRLLGFAGYLHDIGWTNGQKGHHVRSSRMILKDASLPVTSRDRDIIALVARYHRKRVPGKTPRPFSHLKPKAKRRVLVLASLLRIADGLDYTRANRVTAISCTIGPDAVTCTPVYDGDGSIERMRALKKADLFGKVFGLGFSVL